MQDLKQENKSMFTKWIAGALVLVAAVSIGVVVYTAPKDNESSNENTNVAVAKVEVTVGIINGADTKSYPVSLTAGATAYAALQDIATKNNIVVETKDYSGKPFVSGIGGVLGDDSHYWSFEINGASSNVGAGDYTIQAGDKIDFRYVSF